MAQWTKKDIIVLSETHLIRLTMTLSVWLANRGGKATRKQLGWCIAELFKRQGCNNVPSAVEHIIRTY